MPNYGYLPSREWDLAAYCQSLSTKINADPALYGLTLAQGVAYQTAQEAFGAALQTASDPNTRSPTSIGVKNIKKKELITLTRSYVDICQAYPEMTDEKRLYLGIPVRDRNPTPAPIPATAPVVNITSVQGRLINLQLREEGSERRGKPEKVSTAWIYSYLGEDSPLFSQMSFAGSSPKTDTFIVLPESVPVNTKVWISACWVNTTEKPGSVSIPVFTFTNHGTSQNMAA